MPFSWLEYIAIYSPVVPSILGTACWRKNNHLFKLLCFQVVIGFLLDLVLRFWYKGNNTAFYEAFLLLDICLLWLILHVVLIWQKYKKALLLLEILVLTIYFAELVHKPKGVFINITFLIFNLSMCMLFLHLVIETYKHPNLKYYIPTIWASMGMLYYHGCGIPTFAMLNYLIDNDGIIAGRIYFINDILKIIKSLFLAVSFLIIISEANKKLA